jgi:sugar transferase (PEP-CTERM/EpsH1 system associated)
VPGPVSRAVDDGRRRDERGHTANPIIVGHTIWSLSDGGMERGLVNLVNLSSPRDFCHVILCLGETGVLFDRVNRSLCRVVGLRKRPGNDVTIPFKIAAWARHLRLDILHARGWPTLVESAIGGYLGGVRRTVYGFHGKTVGELSRKGVRRRLAETIVPRLYSEIVTLTESMKADVSRQWRLDSARVRVIANGVDTDMFQPCRRRLTLRTEFDLPLDRIILGNVARLDPVKNHVVVLRSLIRLRSMGVEPVLLLIGDGPERPRLEGEIRAYGLTTQVRLLGQSDRIPELLNCMDIYVQPSLYEGFSNTLLEAMACGLPVIATRTGGTVDVVREGQEGHLFDPHDDEALALLILTLTNRDMRQVMGMRGRRRVTENFPLSTMIREYERMYRDLSASERGRRPVERSLRRTLIS